MSAINRMRLLALTILTMIFASILSACGPAGAALQAANQTYTDLRTAENRMTAQWDFVWRTYNDEMLAVRDEFSVYQIGQDKMIEVVEAGMLGRFDKVDGANTSTGEVNPDTARAQVQQTVSAIVAVNPVDPTASAKMTEDMMKSIRTHRQNIKDEWLKFYEAKRVYDDLRLTSWTKNLIISQIEKFGSAEDNKNGLPVFPSDALRAMASSEKWCSDDPAAKAQFAKSGQCQLIGANAYFFMSRLFLDPVASQRLNEGSDGSLLSPTTAPAK